MHVYMCVYVSNMYIYIYMCLSAHVYVYRESERERVISCGVRFLPKIKCRRAE